MREKARSPSKWAIPLIAPVLFAAFPVVSLFEQNQTELALGVLWWPLAIAILGCVAVFAVFALLLRRPPKAGLLASVVVVAFFYYGTWYVVFKGWGFSKGWFIAVWTVLFLVAVFAVLRTRLPLTNLIPVLTVVAAVVTLIPAVKVAAYQIKHPLLRGTDPRVWSAPLEPPVRDSGARLPDIYVLIPDDYARADVLRRYFHYDNAPFVAQLRRRGFVVSGQVRSPYSDSESNIAAELNMDYMSGMPRILGERSQDVRPIKVLIENNRASRLLKPLGYRYIHRDTDEVTFAAGNPHISPVATPDSFMNLWLQNTALRTIGGPIGFNDSAAYQRFRDGINSAFEDLEAVPRQPAPKFVVFHTLLPHDPYIFGPHGEPVTYPNRLEAALNSRRGMRYYLGQVRFVEGRLLKTVDAIRARSKTPPVIVIESDEGFTANPDLVGERAAQDIRVKGLEALYLPGVRRAGVPNPPNTVNTLRFVFNRYFATRYPMLRSASYPELDFPYQYKEMRVR